MRNARKQKQRIHHPLHVDGHVVALWLVSRGSLPRRRPSGRPNYILVAAPSWRLAELTGDLYMCRSSREHSMFLKWEGQKIAISPVNAYDIENNITFTESDTHLLMSATRSLWAIGTVLPDVRRGFPVRATLKVFHRS